MYKRGKEINSWLNLNICWIIVKLFLSLLKLAVCLCLREMCNQHAFATVRQLVWIVLFELIFLNVLINYITDLVNGITKINNLNVFIAIVSNP